MNRISHWSIILLFSLLFVCLIPTAAFADGFIIDPQPLGRTVFPLEVTYHHVKTQIKNQAATTEITQEFYNPTGRRIEGAYIFPVPKGAVIRDFSLEIDGKETKQKR